MIPIIIGIGGRTYKREGELISNFYDRAQCVKSKDKTINQSEKCKNKEKSALAKQTVRKKRRKERREKKGKAKKGRKK